jgi:2-amino-4-hydroxy-6-hydroxymethyldihydropteridine diphosphokinase
MPSLVVLGLGSNKGDSRAILEGAVAELGALLSDLSRASIRETVPLHVPDQPMFLNTAVSGHCALEPLPLLEALHAIEAAHGRERKKERRWGERTLDIDILLYGDQLIALPPVLEIPHPRLNERAFALEPLIELFPEARDPRTGLLYRDILKAL